MKSIDTLLPRVMSYAPSCPEPYAIGKLRDAAIRFCQRTKLWKDVDNFAVTAAGCRELFAPPESQIYEIQSGRIDGMKMTPVTLTYLDKQFPRWREEDETAEGIPAWMAQLTPNSLTLSPRGAGVVDLTLILMPAQDAEDLPDFLVDLYAVELADGAVGEVLVTPEKDFTQPQLAAAFVKRFDDHLNRLAPKGTKGQQRGPLRSRGQYF